MLSNNEVSSNTNFNKNMISFNGRDNTSLINFDESLFLDNPETYYIQEIYRDKEIV